MPEVNTREAGSPGGSGRDRIGHKRGAFTLSAETIS
jgi:hypothetical protein